MRNLTTLILILVSISAFGKAEILFDKANEAYENEDYLLAQSLYDSLVAIGYTSTEIYYNLANSHYKLNETGKSILFFERALKIAPEDEDVIHNLQLANLRVVTKVEEREPVYFKKLVNDFLDLFPLKLISWVSIAFIWFSLFLSVVYIFNNTTRIKKLSFLGLIITLFFFLVSFGIALAKNASLESESEAIIMSTNTYIKSAPGENSTDLFILHEGVKMHLLDEVNDWHKIRIADGKVGWIQSSKFEKI